MNWREERVKQGKGTESEIYAEIVRYFKTHGYAPRHSEIAEILNIDRETVRRHVRNLMERGWLATDNPKESRAIRLTQYEFRKKERKKQ